MAVLRGAGHLVCVLFAVIGTTQVLACVCPVTVPQDHFCQSGTVLKARISTDEEVVEDVGGGAFNPVDQVYIDSLTTPAQKDRIYRRNVLTALRTFKGSVMDSSVYVYTSYFVDEPYCGSSIVQGDYLFMAQVRFIGAGMNIYYDQCSYKELWADADKVTKRRMRKGTYHDKCTCPFNHCDFNGCEMDESANACKVHSYEAHCQTKSFCFESSGVCQWHDNLMTRRCYKTMP